MYTSGQASRNRYIDTYYHWNVQIICGKYGIIGTYIHRSRSIASDVYEYGKGVAYKKPAICAWVLMYESGFGGKLTFPTYICVSIMIKEIKMQMEDKLMYMEKTVCTTIGIQMNI